MLAANLCKCEPEVALTVYLGGLFVLAGTVLVGFSLGRGYRDAGLADRASAIGTLIIGGGTALAFFDPAQDYAAQGEKELLRATLAGVGIVLVVLICAFAPRVKKWLRN